MPEITERIKRAGSLAELGAALEDLFQDHYAIDEEGRLYVKFVEVARFNGIKISINSKEHSPPHFHVRGPGIDASYNIISGEQIAGTVESKYTRKIEFFYTTSRSKLISIWNQTRPSDCPVGPIPEDA